MIIKSFFKIIDTVGLPKRSFKAIEKMNDGDKNVVKTLIDAFITKGKIKQLAL